MCAVKDGLQNCHTKGRIEGPHRRRERRADLYAGVGKGNGPSVNASQRLIAILATLATAMRRGEGESQALCIVHVIDRVRCQAEVVFRPRYRFTTATQTVASSRCDILSKVFHWPFPLKYEEYRQSPSGLADRRNRSTGSGRSSRPRRYITLAGSSCGKELHQDRSKQIPIDVAD